MPNRPESTWRQILKPDAFAMDRGWYSLHSVITGHDSEAMACTPRRGPRMTAVRGENRLSAVVQRGVRGRNIKSKILL